MGRNNQALNRVVLNLRAKLHGVGARPDFLLRKRTSSRGSGSWHAEFWGTFRFVDVRGLLV